MGNLIVLVIIILVLCVSILIDCIQNLFEKVTFLRVILVMFYSGFLCWIGFLSFLVFKLY